MLQHILNIFKKSSPENDTYVFQGESEYTSNDGDYEQGKLITFNAIVPLSDHDSAMNLLCSLLMNTGWSKITFKKSACSLYSGIEEKREVATSDIKVVFYPE